LIQGGYRVVSAANGAEACAIFESRCSEIALVVTDQDMPELDGTGLIRFIRKSRPDFKVLVTSGLTGSSGTSSSDDMAAPFLSKPFTSFELLNEIHRLLSSKSAPL
jgi:CheY-like chemotaxis protein